MVRARHAWLSLLGGACLAAVGCSGSTARDQSFNTDAGSGYEPPVAEISSDVADTGGTAGAAGGTAGGAGGDDAAADAPADVSGAADPDAGNG